MAKQLYYRENFNPNGGVQRPGFGAEQRGDPKDNDSFFSFILFSPSGYTDGVPGKEE